MSSPLQVLEQIETLVALRRHAQAFDLLAGLLGLLRSQFHTRQLIDPAWRGDQGQAHHGHVERICRAYGQVLLDPALDPSSCSGYVGLLGQLTTLHTLAHGSAEGHLDAWMRMSNAQRGGNHDRVSLSRLLLLWTPGSQLGFDLHAQHVHLPELVTAQAVATVGGMVMATPECHAAREAAIAFLVSGRPQPADYARPGVGASFFDAWMRCSYAPAREKDRVKRFLNAVAAGMPFTAREVAPRPRPADGRRVMVVPIEAFDSGHAMFRCYGPALAACRRDYFLVALAERGGLDEQAAALFDICHDISTECSENGNPSLPAIEALVRSYTPDLLLYPSIGMSLYTILLALRRLAPRQVMLYGHPATTWSPAMDVGVVEEQFLGSEDEFSERVLTVPRGTWGYTLPPGIAHPPPRLTHADEAVRIAVPSVAQKWTWPQLEALAAVAARASRPVEFHFFSGVHNMYLPAAEKAVRRFLPQAVVHPYLPYAEYLRRLRLCSIHAGSFPFGGMNSVIDSLVCGLPVVCVAGTRIHGRVDEDFVRRVGLPEWLVAATPDAWADVLLRLVDDPALLAEVRRPLADTARLRAVLFNGGEPERFVAALRTL